MGKVITSPVKRWPGTVTIFDPIPMPQCAKLERSLRDAAALVEPTRGELRDIELPGLLACIESFDLQGIPEKVGADNFPGSPRRSSDELVAWLTEEVLKVYTEESADPLA